ncbi:MAG: glutamate--cysteine ligase [Mariprofundaceae bacterium]
MSEPTLTTDRLIEFIANGCKPESRWATGTEIEKIGFCVDTLKPIPYEGKRSIRALLEMLADDLWQPVYEEGKPIALTSGKATITLEPGGQLELSGAPLATIHETADEIRQHAYRLRQATEQLGIGFLGIGFQPKWQREDIPWMPKDRYAIMRNYMPKVGSLGLDMMLRTATIQTNLDFSSESDMVKKMRVSCCLQPLATAMFAASPFKNGQPTADLTNRARCWEDTDPDRTGIPAIFISDDFSFEGYVQWALDVPLYFVNRNGRFIDCAGASFRDFIRGELTALPGEKAKIADWELHLSTLFPDVRLKQFIELRGADAGGWPWAIALPALWKGILYDAKALDQARAMVDDWTHAELLALRHAVPRLALKTPFRNQHIQHLCEEMLSISRSGLSRIAATGHGFQDECTYLAPLEKALQSGITQADQWLDAYHKQWQGRIEPVFQEAAHT